MATTSRTTQRMLKERSAEATRRLREALGLEDLDVLAIALAEVTTAEAQQNPQLVNSIRSVYDSLMEAKRQSERASKIPSSKTKGSSGHHDEALVPIAIIKDYVADPWAPPDPYFLNRLYGPAQLYAALNRYNLPTLKRSLPIVQARHPGTKPRRISSKDDVITYMVEMVTAEQAGVATA